jgi:hypothetical protein
LINRSFEKRQISMKQTNEFKFQTNLILIVWQMKFGILCDVKWYFINDYNLNNHSYDFVKFNKIGVQWWDKIWCQDKKSTIELTFMDKFENNWKRNFK